VLSYQHFWCIGAQELWDHGVYGAQKARITDGSWHGDVDRITFSLRAANVFGETGARKQQEPGFMDRNGQHPRVVVERLFDPVTMVGINIHIRDPFCTLIQHVLDSYCSIVVNTEPGCRRPLCMMQTTGKIDGAVHFTSP